jgi:hypothetical protein
MSRLQDQLYQAMKVEAKKRGIKASPEHDLYKMVVPYFFNAFYSRELKKEVLGMMCVYLRYEVKYSYFDDITAFIIEGNTDLKLTDKVRANSVIKCPSVITEEYPVFEFDGKDESYSNLVIQIFDHIEKWYRDFFDEVNRKYGDLETFFIQNKEKYPRQAALVYLHSEDFTAAEECLRMMPSKMYKGYWVSPSTKEQNQRFMDSQNVYVFPFSNDFVDRKSRDYMDIHFDFIIAKMNGLEWNSDRAVYGLLKEERCATGSNCQFGNLMKNLKKIWKKNDS